MLETLPPPIDDFWQEGFPEITPNEAAPDSAISITPLSHPIELGSVTSEPIPQQGTGITGEESTGEPEPKPDPGPEPDPDVSQACPERETGPNCRSYATPCGFAKSPPAIISSAS